MDAPAPAEQGHGRAALAATVAFVLLGIAIARELRFHYLRHTFGSRLATHGVSLQVIALALGHTSARMSQRYARPSDEALQSVASALDASISNSAANSPSEEENPVTNGKRASDGAGALYTERVMGIEPTTIQIGKRPALRRDQEPSVGHESQCGGAADGGDQVVVETGGEGDGGGGEGDQRRKGGNQQNPAFDP